MRHISALTEAATTVSTLKIFSLFRIYKGFLLKRLRRDIFVVKINGTILKSQNILVSTKKIPCIPPIFHKNRFVTNFKEKAELFNSFFAKQCSIIDNGSEIPFFLHPKTEKTLSNITLTEKNIEKVIQNLNSTKVYGHDMIKPLLIIYKKCFEEGCSPNKWNKANVVPVHKKMTNSY